MAEDKDLNKSLQAAEGAKPTEVKAPTPPPPSKGVGNLAARLSPSAHKPARKQVVVNDTFDYDTAMHMAFLGAGQGGGRIANSFWGIGYRRVGLFNTTDQDNDGIDAEVPMLSLDIGGAMKDMRLARNALDGRDEEVWDLLQRSWGNNIDCGLICVGLGGGTGSGTALPLVKIARKYLESKNLPQRIGCIVSLPSVDEGQAVCRNAVTAFRELLAEKVSPLLIIDNERVNDLYKPPMAELLPKSNELVSQLLHLFNSMAAAKGHITFDRSEFAQLLDGGVSVLGAANIPVENIESPADVSKAIKDQLAESVLAQVDLRRGHKAACLFVAAKDVLDTFGKDYFAAGFTMLDRIVGSAYEDKNAHPTVIHRGLYQGDDSGLQCYTMISELDPPYGRLQELAKKAGLGTGPGSSMARFLGVDG